jgi:hypothetical protein
LPVGIVFYDVDWAMLTKEQKMLSQLMPAPANGRVHDFCSRQACLAELSWKRLNFCLPFGMGASPGARALHQNEQVRDANRRGWG